VISDGKKAGGNWTLTPDLFLTVEEAARLCAQLRADGIDGVYPDPARILDQVIVESLLWSGLQASEFCRLRLGDVRHGLKKSTFDVVGKRDRRREVFIPTRVGELIGIYVNKIRPRFVASGTNADDPAQPLFLNERGRGFERSTLYRRVTSILTRHGIPQDRASVQLLRHTYGYLAYRLSGSNLLFVQRQLGHAHPMVTAIYAQFVDEDDQETANRLLRGLNDMMPALHVASS